MMLKMNISMKQYEILKKNEKEELNQLKWEFIEESYVSNGGDYEDIKNFKDKEIKPFFIWELEFSEIFEGNNPDLI